MSTTERLAALEATLTAIAGYAVSITVRGLRNFTASFDEVDEATGRMLADFFGPHASCTVHVDHECGTFVYINV